MCEDHFLQLILKKITQISCRNLEGKEGKHRRKKRLQLWTSRNKILIEIALELEISEDSAMGKCKTNSVKMKVSEHSQTRT